MRYVGPILNPEGARRAWPAKTVMTCKGETNMAYRKGVVIGLFLAAILLFAPGVQAREVWLDELDLSVLETTRALSSWEVTL